MASDNLGLCFCFHKKNWEYNNKKQINFNFQKIKDKLIKEIFLDILVNMASTIDMQEIRYLNLVERIMGVRTRFFYKLIFYFLRIKIYLFFIIILPILLM